MSSQKLTILITMAFLIAVAASCGPNLKLVLDNSGAQLVTVGQRKADFYAVIKNESWKPIDVMEIDGRFCGTLNLKIDDLELQLREPDFHRALTEVAIKSQTRTVEAHSSIAYPIVLRTLVSVKEIPGDKSWTNLLTYYTNETVRIMAVGDWVAGKPRSDWMLLKVDRLQSVN